MKDNSLLTDLVENNQRTLFSALNGHIPTGMAEVGDVATFHQEVITCSGHGQNVQVDGVIDQILKTVPVMYRCQGVNGCVLVSSYEIVKVVRKNSQNV